MTPVEHNPYTPPQATVADQGVPVRPAEKPQQVRRAVLLLWLMLGLGVLNSALQWRLFPASSSALAVVLSTQAAAMAIVVWLTLKISAGRNWARITYLIWALIGLPGIVLTMPVTLGVSGVSAALTVVQVGLQIWALLLVFTEPGRQWFRPRAVEA